MDSKRGNRIDNGKGIPEGAKPIRFKPNRKRILQNASYIQSKNCIPYRAKLCRAKVTNFLKGDENFARQSFANQNLPK